MANTDKRHPLAHGSTNGPKKDEGSWAFKQARKAEELTTQEKSCLERIRKYLWTLTHGAIGLGEDPVGFLLASHSSMLHDRKLLVSHEFRIGALSPHAHADGTPRYLLYFGIKDEQHASIMDPADPARLVRQLNAILEGNLDIDEI